MNSRQPAELLSRLNGINIHGGGDCPEMALLGLNNALNHSLHNSIAYVFSDASAKDFHLADSIIHTIQKKQVKVNFLLTGVCPDGKSAPGFQVYERISRASDGQVFDMKRDNLKKVFSALTFSLDSKFESLKSVDYESAGSSETPVSVDESVKSVSVSVSGTNSKLSVTNRDKSPITADREVASDNTKFIIFTPTDKAFSVAASAESAYSIRVGGISDLKFEFGFATKTPDTQAETSIQPLVDKMNVITVFPSDTRLVKCLTKATIAPVTANEFTPFDVPLIRFKGTFFSSSKFTIPKKMFKIQIFGYDAKGNEIDRIISTGIDSIAGSKLNFERFQIIINIIIYNNYHNL